MLRVVWLDDLSILGERYKETMTLHDIDLFFTSDYHEFSMRIENEDNFDVIVIDLKMEKFNPIEYLISKKSILHKIPVCIISGYSDEPNWIPRIENLERYFEKVAVISKPLPPPTNKSFVRNVIETIKELFDSKSHIDDYSERKKIAESYVDSGKDVNYEDYLTLAPSFKDKILEKMATKYFKDIQEKLVANNSDWAIVLSDGTIHKYGKDDSSVITDEEMVSIGEKTKKIPMIFRKTDAINFEEIAENESYIWPSKNNDYYPTMSFRIKDLDKNQLNYSSNFDTGSESSWCDAKHFISYNVVDDSFKNEVTFIRNCQIRYFEKTIELILTDGKRDKRVFMPLKFVNNWNDISFFHTNKFGRRVILVGRNILFQDDGIDIVLKGKDKKILVYNPK